MNEGTVNERAPQKYPIQQLMLFSYLYLFVYFGQCLPVSVILYALHLIHSYFSTIKLFLVHMRKFTMPVFHRGLPRAPELKVGSQWDKRVPQNCLQDCQALRGSPMTLASVHQDRDISVLECNPSSTSIPALDSAPGIGSSPPACSIPSLVILSQVWVPSGGGCLCTLTSVCCLPGLSPPTPSLVLHAEPDPAQPHAVRAGQ